MKTTTIIASFLVLFIPIGGYLLWIAAGLSGPEVSKPWEIRLLPEQRIEYGFETKVSGEFSLVLEVDRSSSVDPRKDLEKIEGVGLDWRILGPGGTPIEAARGSSVLAASYVGRGLATVQLRSGLPYHVEAFLHHDLGDVALKGPRLVLALSRDELIHFGLLLAAMRIAGITLCVLGCFGGLWAALALRRAIQGTEGRVGESRYGGRL